MKALIFYLSFCCPQLIWKGWNNQLHCVIQTHSKKIVQYKLKWLFTKQKKPFTKEYSATPKTLKEAYTNCRLASYLRSFPANLLSYLTISKTSSETRRRNLRTLSLVGWKNIYFEKTARNASKIRVFRCRKNASSVLGWTVILLTKKQWMWR